MSEQKLKTKRPFIRMTVRIDGDIREYVEEESLLNDRTMAGQINWMLRHFLPPKPTMIENETFPHPAETLTAVGGS